METDGTKEPDCRLRMFADDGVICVESRLQEEGKLKRWRRRCRFALEISEEEDHYW